MTASANLVTAIWAAAMAVCALPYLSLLRHVRIEPSETMQWSLLAVGVIGSVSILYMAWRESRRPAWRASHGVRPLS